MTKPYSQACENNKHPILNVLKQTLSDSSQLLEIGSGSGQHAAFFAKHLPHLTWHTSDLQVNHDGINAWLAQADLPNIQPPVILDLQSPWPINQIDSIFTANTLHIVDWSLVIKFFHGVNKHLQLNGTLCIYGPFNYNDQYTSQSNADFDQWLKQRNTQSGIRDIEAVIQQANQAGLRLVNDHSMPANNRLLEFIKQS